jgi:hypothetical protein
VGGLLSPFGDALLGQCLAQPGMLVVHLSLLLSLRLLRVGASLGRPLTAASGGRPAG